MPGGGIRKMNKDNKDGDDKGASHWRLERHFGGGSVSGRNKLVSKESRGCFVTDSPRFPADQGSTLATV